MSAGTADGKDRLPPTRMMESAAQYFLFESIDDPAGLLGIMEQGVRRARPRRSSGSCPTKSIPRLVIVIRLFPSDCNVSILKAVAHRRPQAESQLVRPARIKTDKLCTRARKTLLGA